MSATKFRDKATIWLLAARKELRLQQYIPSINEMLDTVGKYSILLRTGDTGYTPMSARIAADIERRHLKDPWDRLAITANTCDYEIRLDHRYLADQRLSISISLLAQYLLNGEIFVDRSHRRCGSGRVLDVRVTQWMSDTSDWANDLPFESRQLTFLKGCRLPNVSFTVYGVQTIGLVWHLPRSDRIRTNDFPQRRRTTAHTHGYPGELWKAEELPYLLRKLQRNHEQLARKLRAYIQNRRRGVNSSACVYMDAMACKVMQAIRRGRDLNIRRTGQPGCLGIFIPRQNNSPRDLRVFTAWQPGSPAASGIDIFVSLSVKEHQGTLSAQNWINGLAFFHEEDTRAVTFAWPKGWDA